MKTNEFGDPIYRVPASVVKKYYPCSGPTPPIDINLREILDEMFSGRKVTFVEAVERISTLVKPSVTVGELTRLIDK